MSNFETLLTEIRKDITGKSFEKFCKWFLENDPYWKTQVEQVWFFDDWPEKWHRDKGVDLVFKHKNGQNWAVQAKCYSEKYYIKKEDIDSFLSESSRKIIHQRLLIGTTDKIGINAIETMSGQDKPVRSFLLNEIKNSGLEYPSSMKALYSKVSKKKISKNRPYQQLAIKKVVEGFKEYDKGKLIMACGTGKTLVTLWIKEKLKPQTTLILLPSLNLLSQTLFEWTTHCKDTFEVLCICSDSTVGKQERAEDMKVNEAHFDVTSDISTISQFLKSNEPKVIFCTYQSSDLVSQAQKKKEIDLVICDEAHRCTGIAKSTFTKVLDNRNIKAKKRLFTTATPRIFSSQIKTVASKENKEVYGMDDETIYGPEFYKYTFSQAIDDQWLTNYQVVIVGVDEPAIKASIDQRELIVLNKNQYEDAETLASKISIAKAIKDYEITRMISFHNRVKEAQNFSNDFQDILRLINKKHRPKGIIWTDYISGQMSAKDRKLKLQHLKILPNFDIGIISNARCLSEGVDVPALDGITFVEPKASQIDIIQSVGRALRKSENKNVGTIILPVFIRPGDNHEDCINNSNFKPVWDILKALSSHDNQLDEELINLRQQLGSRVKKPYQKFPEKIIFNFPKNFDTKFINSLKTIIVENTTEQWFFYFGMLKEYVQKNNSVCARSYITIDGYELGEWVTRQRSEFKRNRLRNFKVSLLDTIKEWSWDPQIKSWNDQFGILKTYLKKNGNIYPTSRFITKDNKRLGAWYHYQMQLFRNQKLDRYKIETLTKLPNWSWDLNEKKWEYGYSELKKYLVENNNKYPKAKFKTLNGFSLGMWIDTQRQDFKEKNLKKERIKLLNNLPNWTFDVILEKWNKNYQALSNYVDMFKKMPSLSYNSEDGVSLLRWANKQRTKFRNNKLSNKEITLLKKLPIWTWDPINSQWQHGYTKLKEYIDKNKSICANRYKTKEGFGLGGWDEVQKTNYRKKNLSKEKIALLEDLSIWEWDPYESQWQYGYMKLKEYIDKNKSICKDKYKTNEGFGLGSWVSRQRRMYKESSISKERIKLLDDLKPYWKWEV